MSPFTLDYLGRLETWALLATLIQGLLVWLSWAAWERSTPVSAARLRHRLACLHLFALVLLPALTLVGLQWNVAGMVYAVRCDAACAAADPSPWLAVYRRLLAGAAAPAAFLWATGTLVLAARLVLAALRLRRLKTYPASARMVGTVERLASRWSGRPALEVREAEVDAPQVIGLLRPTLLLPPRFEERLQSRECEAVLLHELAHASRRDFGWNLLQRLVLALVWFHPAAWRLYGHLSRERELRCDALAVRNGASPVSLAKALVSLAEARACPRLAMALSGRSDLSLRLRRLIGPEGDERSLRRSRPAFALIVSALCLLTLAAGRLAWADRSVRDAYVASAFGPTISLEAHDRAGGFAVQVRHGRIVSASVGRTPALIVQHGERAVLFGQGHGAVVALTVSPEGRIRWTSRS